MVTKPKDGFEIENIMKRLEYNGTVDVFIVDELERKRLFFSSESEEEREKAAQNWFSKRLGDLSKEQKNESREMSELAAMAKLAK